MRNQIEFLRDEDGMVMGRAWKCRCGAKVESYMAMDVDCDRCDRMFNGYGQELAPVIQWEENES